MPEREFVAGDKITLTKTPDGWKIELLLASGKGIIAPAAGAIYSSPEDALDALRDQAKRASRG